MNKKAIGIFDSGAGGLTVLKAVNSLLPSEDLVYLGDTARVPYGIKSRSTVSRYTRQNTAFLIQKGIKALVIACNTASAYGVGDLEELFQVPVIDVIRPGAHAGLRATRSREIGVIGTEATIRSEAYPSAIAAVAPDVRVISKPCPLFVPLAEEGLTEGDLVDLACVRYLQGFKKEKKMDTLILGCTHYPLLKNAIRKYLGKGVTLVDSAEATAQSLKNHLEKNNLLTASGKKGALSVFATDSPERMQILGEIFFGGKLGSVEIVDLA